MQTMIAQSVNRQKKEASKNFSDLSSKRMENLSVQDYLQNCFDLETAGNLKSAEDWLMSGLGKFASLKIYTESLGFFFFRRKKYNKVLEYLKKSVQASDPVAIEVAIKSAYMLTQHHLVWDYFLLLVPAKRAALDPGLLRNIAISAMEEGYYPEAEKILMLIRNNAGGKALPPLSEVIKKEFSSPNKLQDFMNDMKKRGCDNATIESLSDYITYGCVLISQNRFTEALGMLERVKTKVA